MKKYLILLMFLFFGVAGVLISAAQEGSIWKHVCLRQQTCQSFDNCIGKNKGDPCYFCDGKEYTNFCQYTGNKDDSCPAIEGSSACDSKYTGKCDPKPPEAFDLIEVNPCNGTIFAGECGIPKCKDIPKK